MNPTLKKILPFAVTGILLLLGALSIYAILVGPSKEPYREALTQYKNVYNANITVLSAGSALNASSATDEQFEKSLDTVTKAFDSLKLENEALAKKDVLKEGEGQKLYADFNTKLQAYLAYNKDVVTSMKVVRPIVYDCTQRLSTVSEDAQGVDAMNRCANDLKDLGAVPDEDYKKMATSFRENYLEMARLIAQMAALDDPKGADKAAYTKLEKEREQIVENLSQASKEFSQDLQVSRQKVDITPAAQSLDDYLSRKASIF